MAQNLQFDEAPQPDDNDKARLGPYKLQINVQALLKSVNLLEQAYCNASEHRTDEGHYDPPGMHEIGRCCRRVKAVIQPALTARHQKQAWLVDTEISSELRLPEVIERLSKVIEQRTHKAAPEWVSQARRLLNEMVGDSPAKHGIVQGENPQTQPAGDGKSRHKRSTEKNEARVKIIAGLTAHHQYETDSCLNQDPVVVNRFAAEIGVSPSTLSEFFKMNFGSHANYRAACQDAAALAKSLGLLRGEIPPSILFNRLPDECHDADDDG